MSADYICSSQTEEASSYEFSFDGPSTFKSLELLPQKIKASPFLKKKLFKFISWRQTGLEYFSLKFRLSKIILPHLEPF